MRYHIEWTRPIILEPNYNFINSGRAEDNLPTEPIWYQDELLGVPYEIRDEEGDRKSDHVVGTTLCERHASVEIRTTNISRRMTW